MSTTPPKEYVKQSALPPVGPEGLDGTELVTVVQKNQSKNATAAQLADAVAKKIPAGVIGYATKAEMDADLSPPARAVAMVTNDPAHSLENPANGYYRKEGESGAGSWVADAGPAADAARLVSQEAVTRARADAATRRVGQSNAFMQASSQLRPIYLDDNGRPIFSYDAEGRFAMKLRDFEVMRGFGPKPVVFVDHAMRELPISGDAPSVGGAYLERQDFGLIGMHSWLDAFRQKYRSGQHVNVLMLGDSLTQGSDNHSIPDALYRKFGAVCGYGGFGFVPFRAGLGPKGSAGDVFVTGTPGWQGWWYLDGAAPQDGSQNWLLKAGLWGKYGTAGTASIWLAEAYRGRPNCEFDTIKVHAYATGGDVQFRCRASGGDWIDATATGSTVSAPVYTVVSVAGFGAETGRYNLHIEITGGSGTLQIAGLEYINSAGGVRIHKVAIGGYKAGDHSDRNAAAHAHFFSSLGCDLAIINLGENDAATSGSAWKVNMQTIINRLRSAKPGCPILLIQWFTPNHAAKSQQLDELAKENDLRILRISDVVPSLAWAGAKGMQLTSDPADPHLKAAGAEYVANYIAGRIGINTITENLRA